MPVSGIMVAAVARGPRVRGAVAALATVMACAEVGVLLGPATGDSAAVEGPGWKFSSPWAAPSPLEGCARAAGSRAAEARVTMMVKKKVGDFLSIQLSQRSGFPEGGSAFSL